MVSLRGKLSALQVRVLEAVAPTEPRFVLSGGAALAGFHLQHRQTRDLDLFWRNRERLEELPRSIETSLSNAGFIVETLQTSPAFVQLRVGDKSDAVVVDLIAEPAGNLDAPQRQRVGNAEVLIDSPRAILAEKLCALLERSEVRDLIDIEALVNSGQNLDAALNDAPKRDTGYSPLTLAWVLHDLDVNVLGPSAGLDERAAANLDRFRLALIDRLADPRR